MKKVVIFSNHHAYTYNFRKEIIQRLLDEHYKIYVVLPYGEKVELLKKMGCEFIDLPLDRRGMNPITDLKLLLSYNKVIRKIKPDVVLSYTIKPNIYGALVCRRQRVPFIANVTGLGSAVDNKGLFQKIIIQLYRLAFSKVSCTFFQNQSNQLFFKNKQIINGRYRVIPGSGVNLKQHSFEEYPIDSGLIRFLFIGRVMKDKGIEELVDAATLIKKEYSNVQFDAIGFYEKDYEERAKELGKLGVINFHGVKDNVHEYINKSNAVVLPSYHEGMANVLLEAASTGRPVIASNISGCKETFDEGVSGLGFEVKNSAALTDALIKFINLPYEQKKAMGVAGRKKMEREFDRNIVVNAYIDEIDRITDEVN
ncbi:glycosyltransferase family 4 protein [Bacillus norwichensis]|uniref:Glycosyltransferase family 4 protein n=1 Tax=Bacillus norwichensis TaxID=2762217 RepID=A0ABR8VHP6_9BACI|nr:glycosyltransferase family 4 protein [Bacillus norwichensis]MBD8004260.1 glycosyltransferase family 4 protein [Bacillus norwichensis]